MAKVPDGADVDETVGGALYPVMDEQPRYTPSMDPPDRYFIDRTTRPVPQYPVPQFQVLAEVKEPHC
jgi:hypothetical protein